jgi:hypothetical protein
LPAPGVGIRQAPGHDQHDPHGAAPVFRLFEAGFQRHRGRDLRPLRQLDLGAVAGFDHRHAGRRGDENDQGVQFRQHAGLASFRRCE